MSYKPSEILATLKKGIVWLEQKKILKSFRISSRVIWNLFLIFISASFISLFLFGGVAMGYFASLVHKQPVLSYDSMKKDIEDYSESSTIFFAGNKQLGRLKTDLIRTDVALKDVSPNYTHALLATEDQLFYEHSGVVPKSVFRALVQELTNQPQVTGGSTITQQLVKNQILTNEVSFERKAKEILLSLRLEKFFNKDQILDAYINVIPFGRNAAGQNIAGVETAAKGIFGVKAKDLSLPQAAFIAGIPKNPFTYTPFMNSGGVKSDISAGVNRAHVVLKRMLDAGYITNDQYKKALTYDYKKHFVKKSDAILSKYPYLMPEVRSRATKILAIQDANAQGYDGNKLSTDYDQLNNLETYVAFEKGQGYKLTIQQASSHSSLDYDTLRKHSDLYQEFYDNAGKQLDRNGYKIYTTVDKNVYDNMQKAADSYKNYESDKVIFSKDPNTGEKIKTTLPMELGAVLIQNNTGAIVGFVGGRENKMQYSQVNHALDSRRQNGSTMKPLLDYGPAIENGLLSPGTILADLPTAYPGSPPYTPHNYGASGNGLFHGFETARTALAQSHNLPAIQTYYMNEHAFQPLDYLKKMGFSSLIYPDKGPLPVAIGGLTLGTTVEEDTNAYATFANGGNFVDAYMIEKIVDKNGKVVYQHKAKPVKVFTPQTSYMVIDMLRDVINRGTAAGLKGMLNFNSGDLYGKTGTTQNWNDSWMVAANPNMTLGVWNGFDQQAQLNPYTYHQHNSQIWASLANAAYKADPSLMVPKDQFKMPSGVVRTSFCGLTGGPVTPACKQAGMVSTDLVNVKYRPSKSSDGAFTNGKYVLINGKKFEALPTTPSVFTMGGTLLSESFIKTHFPYLEWNKISANPLKSALSVTPFKPDGRSPSPVSASLSNGKLSWSRSGSNDVVGYRIYQADNGSTNFHVIKEVMSDTQSVSAAQDGKAYYVTAVDITGKESAPSQKVNSGNWNPTPSVPTTPPAKGTGDGSGTGAPQNSNPTTGNGSTDSNQNPPGTVSDQGTTTGQTVKTQSTTTTTTPNKP